MAAVALYTALAGANLSLVAVRLSVDGGLLLIVLISIASANPSRCNTPASRWIALIGTVLGSCA